MNGCMVGWNVVIDYISQRAAKQQQLLDGAATAPATAPAGKES
jgi:hypothetical protein